jgi:glycosyltransferase involved in cell wall biosynthesis
MMISIITASLNSGQTIRNCIESIKSQSFSHFEHIVSDGGSIDETLDFLKHYEGLYPLRWISEPDRGIADALNKGIGLATGRYLLVLQADDALVDGTVLNRVHKLIRDERYDICSFPVIRERPELAPFNYRAIRLPGWYHFRHTIPHQGAFVHRRVFDKIGAFRTEFSIVMDYDFFYRAFQAGMKVKIEKQPVAVMGGSGVSSNPSYLKKRIMEEFRVQRMNERSRIWRLAQWIFQKLYFPYKTKLHRLHSS